MLGATEKSVLFVSIFTLCLLGTGLAKHIAQPITHENNGNSTTATASSVHTVPSVDERELPPRIFPGEDVGSSTEVLSPNLSQTPPSKEELPPRVFPGDNSGSSDMHSPPEVFPKTPEEPPKIFPSGNNPIVLTTELKVTTAKSTENKLVANDGEENATSIASKGTQTDKYASEVPDLLNTDGTNRTVYEDGTEPPVEKDTVTVQGPHVVSTNKTHEEDVTKSSVEKKVPVIDKENETVTDDKKTNVATSTESLLNNTETVDEDHLNITAALEEQDGSNVTNLETVTKSATEEEVSTKNAESTSATPVTDTAVIQSNKTVEKSKDSVPERSKEKKKSDNKTVKDDVTSASASKEPGEAPTSSRPATDAPTAAVQTTLKAESTTSVNISENLIDHRAEPMVASQDHADHQHASMGKTSAFLQPTESAAILAGVFVGIALIGYVGLLVWRRVLEKRYGNREMLVNEDDFYDTNDLRNFEL